jgi:DNA-binding NarL/FixJ family response regulator
VNRKESHARTGVCLMAFRPFALAEFERLLASGPFRITSRRLEVNSSGAVVPATIPPASVYVLEAHAALAATEEAFAALAADVRSPRVIAVGERLDEASAFALLRWGVKGLLDFLETIDQLPAAVREVARGGYWVPRSILSRFVEQVLTSARRPGAVPGVRLSPREREVRDLLLENVSNREIADRLHVSERTVQFHVSGLLSKFRVKRRADLIVLASGGGWESEGG